MSNTSAFPEIILSKFEILLLLEPSSLVLTKAIKKDEAVFVICYTNPENGNLQPLAEILSNKKSEELENAEIIEGINMDEKSIELLRQYTENGNFELEVDEITLQ